MGKNKIDFKNVITLDLTKPLKDAKKQVYRKLNRILKNAITFNDKHGKSFKDKLTDEELRFLETEHIARNILECLDSIALEVSFVEKRFIEYKKSEGLK